MKTSDGKPISRNLEISSLFLTSTVLTIFFPKLRESEIPTLITIFLRALLIGTAMQLSAPNPETTIETLSPFSAQDTKDTTARNLTKVDHAAEKQKAFRLLDLKTEKMVGQNFKSDTPPQATARDLHRMEKWTSSAIKNLRSHPAIDQEYNFMHSSMYTKADSTIGPYEEFGVEA